MLHASQFYDYLAIWRDIFFTLPRKYEFLQTTDLGIAFA